MASVKTSDRPTGRRSAETEHRPYVPDDARVSEFTWTAVILGSVLGIIFGASSLYLALKVGMTVSASIPVAVLSITLFRVFSRVFGIRKASILENNIVQTAGSAGESIAFGVGVTMPALMILGFDMDIGRVIVVSVLGGLLGILMMIPLRRAFIVKQHGTLKYPEGTACADVLIVGEEGGSSAQTVFVGFGVAFVYEFLRLGMKFWKEVAARPLSWYRGAVASIEVNPTLLGVGYIIGTRISCIMVAGGVLTSFVLVPAIHMFGDPLGQMLSEVPADVARQLPAKPLYPGDKFISAMSQKDITDKYTLYIGAGAVAAGGIISLVQALPLIIGSLVGGVRDLRTARASGRGERALRRTDRDLPLWVVFAGAIVLVAAIWSTGALNARIPWIPSLEVNWLGAIMIVLFGFLFVTVSSRLTGEIGSSSNPISGMTVATLLFTCLIFLALGMTSQTDRLAAISVAAVVCIASSNGGTTSQDLKTGFLVGATPKYQQLAILIGTLTSALVIGAILIMLNNASTVYSQRNLPQPVVPIDVSTLKEQEKAPDDPNIYLVWHAVEGNPQQVKPGKYLVDKAGRIHYIVDPGVNGRLNNRDDGTDVVKYDAPKAALMALITDGILNQRLPWTLVLLG
ncbi:MAG TPA: oligopeptide transporter, OPT family, partial [Pirellulales bacterium]|nr:oligopeptide transporter, OPT family [Pirellulales bacterium]